MAIGQVHCYNVFFGVLGGLTLAVFFETPFGFFLAADLLFLVAFFLVLGLIAVESSSSVEVISSELLALVLAVKPSAAPSHRRRLS